MRIDKIFLDRTRYMAKITDKQRGYLLSLMRYLRDEDFLDCIRRYAHASSPYFSGDTIVDSRVYMLNYLTFAEASNFIDTLKNTDALNIYVPAKIKDTHVLIDGIYLVDKILSLKEIPSQLGRYSLSIVFPNNEIYFFFLSLKQAQNMLLTQARAKNKGVIYIGVRAGKYVWSAVDSREYSDIHILESLMSMNIPAKQSAEDFLAEGIATAGEILEDLRDD